MYLSIFDHHPTTGTVVVQLLEVMKSSPHNQKATSIFPTVCVPRDLVMISTALDLQVGGGEMTYLPTGSKKLDQLLEGGVRCGEILEISGCSGSGKTQLVHSLAIQQGVECTIIDTSHGVCPERLAEMVPSSSTVALSLGDVTILNVHNLFQLYETLESVPSTTQLLIVDCVSMFIASEFSKGYAGQAAVENISKMLRCISRTYNTAIVVTNGVVANRNTKQGERATKPALGRAWSFTPDRRLMLNSEDEYTAPGTCSSRRADMRCSIEVTSTGVRLRGGE
jgi:RecA/RadA recombinase